MGRIITITSGKGGVGKTTITSNLGTALALLGKKVCLVDADIGLRNLDIPLGLSNRILHDILDYADGICELNHAILRDKRLPNLAFMPGSKEYTALDLPCDVFQQIVQELARDFEYVLIDSPAGIEHGFKNAILASTESIVVAIPDQTSIQDADRILGIIEEIHTVPPVLIMNMLKKNSSEYMNFNDNQVLFSRLHLDVLGAVYKDIEIVLSIHKGIPIALDSKQESGLMFRHIARNLINHEFRQYIPTEVRMAKKKRSSFFKMF